MWFDPVEGPGLLPLCWLTVMRIIKNVEILPQSRSTTTDGDHHPKILLLQRYASEGTYPWCTKSQVESLKNMTNPSLDWPQTCRGWLWIHHAQRRNCAVQLLGWSLWTGVKMNPDEHQAFACVKKGESLDNMPITPSIEGRFRCIQKIGLYFCWPDNTMARRVQY